MNHENNQIESIDSTAENLKKGLFPFPFIIEIHPTDVCNQRCDYCFHEGIGFGNSPKKEQLFTLAEYKALFREMKELGIKNLSIAGGGEPFLDVRMPQILYSSRGENLGVRIVTNGNIISNEAMKEVMYCEEIRFSVDTIKPETYFALRHVSANELLNTLSNIQRTVELKKSSDSTLSVGATFLVNSKNYVEAEEFSRYMLNLGVDAVIIKYNIYGIFGISEEDLQKTENTLHKINDPRIELRDRTPINPAGLKCYIPFFKVAMNSYGDLYSCCLGSQPREQSGYLLGNLHGTSFKDVWKGAETTVQQMLISGVGCKNCNYTDHKINRRLISLLSN